MLVYTAAGTVVVPVGMPPGLTVGTALLGAPVGVGTVVDAVEGADVLVGIELVGEETDTVRMVPALG